MRNIIVTMIFLLTLVGANSVVAQAANKCIACQNRCLKYDQDYGDAYAECKMKCKNSDICLGHKKR